VAENLFNKSNRALHLFFGVILSGSLGFLTGYQFTFFLFSYAASKISFFRRYMVLNKMTVQKIDPIAGLLQN
jgi:hypothetical protein